MEASRVAKAGLLEYMRLMMVPSVCEPLNELLGFLCPYSLLPLAADLLPLLSRVKPTA